MGLIETQAIVLRTYQLAEADKIVVCLTRDAGIIRGVARGARRLKSKFGASLEPFTHINIAFHQKEERELVTIRQAEILKSYFNLVETNETIATLGYFAQLAIEFAPPNQTEERMFRLVKTAIIAAFENLDLLSQIAIYFELWILKLGGFLPDMNTCGKCRGKLNEFVGGVYANFEGVLFCEECKHPEFNHLNENLYDLLTGMRKFDALHWARRCACLTTTEQRTFSQTVRRLIVRALEKAPHVKLLAPTI